MANIGSRFVTSYEVNPAHCARDSEAAISKSHLWGFYPSEESEAIYRDSAA